MDVALKGALRWIHYVKFFTPVMYTNVLSMSCLCRCTNFVLLSLGSGGHVLHSGVHKCAGIVCKKQSFGGCVIVVVCDQCLFFVC